MVARQLRNGRPFQRVGAGRKAASEWATFSVGGCRGEYGRKAASEWATFSVNLLNGRPFYVANGASFGG